jgi:hypothetical protein
MGIKEQSRKAPKKFSGITVVAKFIRENGKDVNRGRFEWNLKQ